MKKIFYLLLLSTFWSCVEEMTLHEESPPSETSKPYTGLALFFQQKLNQLPRSRTSQTGLLEGRGTPLYEHVQVGNNKFYGGYYFIVPLQNSRGQIDAGLVYPVMGNDTINGYDFSDELGEPSILDAATLNGITHRGQRFLLSNKFLNWKKEGLSVSRGLYAYADSLDGKHYFTPFTSNASRQGSRSTRTVEEYPYDASVIIFYDILPSIDLDGGVVVSTPSVEASRLVFEGAFGSIGSIDGLGECSLTSVSGGEVYLQMTVTNQDVVENVVQVFMDAAISRFQLEHDVSRISYLYDYFLTERVEPPSGGEDGGSGVGGGNSNGGGEDVCPLCQSNPCTCPTIREVTFTITAQTTGRYAKLWDGYDGATAYKVPLYHATLTGSDQNGNPVSSSYEVIRFGVKRIEYEVHVVGLANENVYTVHEFIPLYHDTGVPAWTITGDHLIHAGPSNLNSATQYRGCIGICNGQMSHFHSKVLEYSGAQTAEVLSTSGKFKVHVKQAVRPPLEIW